MVTSQQTIERGVQRKKNLCVMRWAGKASQRGWYLLCIRSGMGGGLQTGWEEEVRFPREARVGRTYQRWILTKHVQKPLLARVAISCKGAGFGEEKGVSASRQHTETQIHCISLITSSQPKKKKIVRFLLYARQSWTWGKAEE